MAAPKTVDETPAKASHIKFTGMSAETVDEPCGLGDMQTFTVTARCIGEGRELRKDGELRAVRRMEVINVEAGGITKSPQLALVDREDVRAGHWDYPKSEGPAADADDQPDDDE